MQISERVRTMKPSLTLSVNTRAMELRAQGIQVTSLAVGSRSSKRRATTTTSRRTICSGARSIATAA